MHHARLHRGENVVVKVQKDGIESCVETDLSMLADLAALAERHIDDLKFSTQLPSPADPTTRDARINTLAARKRIVSAFIVQSIRLASD
jgi:hypothetical protein